MLSRRGGFKFKWMLLQGPSRKNEPSFHPGEKCFWYQWVHRQTFSMQPHPTWFPSRSQRFSRATRSRCHWRLCVAVKITSSLLLLEYVCRPSTTFCKTREYHSDPISERLISPLFLFEILVVVACSPPTKRASVFFFSKQAVRGAGISWREQYCF